VEERRGRQREDEQGEEPAYRTAAEADPLAGRGALDEHRRACSEKNSVGPP
jgi:hypothetical protein